MSFCKVTSLFKQIEDEYIDGGYISINLWPIFLNEMRKFDRSEDFVRQMLHAFSRVEERQNFKPQTEEKNQRASVTGGESMLNAKNTLDSWELCRRERILKFKIASEVFELFKDSCSNEMD